MSEEVESKHDWQEEEWDFHEDDNSDEDTSLTALLAHHTAIADTFCRMIQRLSAALPCDDESKANKQVEVRRVLTIMKDKQQETSRMLGSTIVSLENRLVESQAESAALRVRLQQVLTRRSTKRQRHRMRKDHDNDDSRTVSSSRSHVFLPSGDVSLSSDLSLSSLSASGDSPDRVRIYVTGERSASTHALKGGRVLI
jgi:hypothetical protein